MNFSILYIVENGFYYVKNEDSEKIFVNTPKGVIMNSKINNIKSFCKYFEKMLIKNDIKKLFSNGNLKIIITDNYTNFEKKIIYSCFKEINFNKVDFINEKISLDINKNKVVINIQKSIAYIHYIKENIVVTDVFISNIQIEKLLELYKELLKSKKVYISIDLEKNNTIVNKNFYIFQNYVDYLIKNIYKMNKNTKKLDF